MTLSHVQTRRALPLTGVLAGCIGACAGERDVTRVLVADISVEIAPATPDAAATDSSGSADPSAESPDAGSVRGPCGVGRRPTYEFSSRFVPGASSVEYSRAALSHVLILELVEFIESVTGRVEARERFEEGDLVAAAGLWLESSGDVISSVELSLSLPGDPALLQQRHGDLADGSSLVALLAGSDPVADHRPWATPGSFVGFEDIQLGRGGRMAFSPEELVRACLEQIEINARNRAIGLFQTDPARNALPPHLTSSGRDLAQLVQSFLLSAVAFSRAVDADLDDDVPGFGLLASTERAGDAPYSALEHAWDMGFGYFGAARDYDRGLADATSGPAAAWFDTNADCFISLDGEVSYGAALHAARAAAERGAEDYGRLAFDALVEGRRWAAAARGVLHADQIDELVRLRDRAAGAWERALAVASVRALNRLSAQLEEALASTADYSFSEQARLWSELKGTSLAFQFNRRSPFSAADFAGFHRLIGDAPRVPGTLPPANSGELGAYLADLRQAREILRSTYGFDAAGVERW
jgi:hypothetical protein